MSAEGTGSPATPSRLERAKLAAGKIALGVPFGVILAWVLTVLAGVLADALTPREGPHVHSAIRALPRADAGARPLTWHTQDAAP